MVVKEEARVIQMGRARLMYGCVFCCVKSTVDVCLAVGGSSPVEEVF